MQLSVTRVLAPLAMGSDSVVPDLQGRGGGAGAGLMPEVFTVHPLLEPIVGNVKVSHKTKTGSTITNIMYDQGKPGFNPSAWPVTIYASMKSTQICCADVDQTVYVHNSVSNQVDKLVQIAMDMSEMHATVRVGKNCGTMHPFGMHLHHGSGKAVAISKGKKCPPTPISKKRDIIQHGIEQAGTFFNAEFTCNPHYGTMLELQRKINLKNVNNHPACWMVSCNLANAMHVDKNDASRSFVIWISQSQTERHTWWFLLPTYGVAIQLCHGRCISWDGSKIEHCTSMPSAEDIHHGNLYALFTAVPKNLIHVEERRALCKSHFKSLDASRAVAEQLEVGMKVFAKRQGADKRLLTGELSKRQQKRLAKKTVKYIGATVIKITEQDGIKFWTFKWEDHHKETFGRWQVNNRVVLTT